MKIALVDYNRGNIRSVAKALEHVGASVFVSQDPEAIAKADGLVVPGQGAFGDCVQNLKNLGLWEPIRAHIKAKKPFLGICIGLQILFEESEESPGVAGLGIFSGSVKRFRLKRPDLKIPHMGWNTLSLAEDRHPLWHGLPAQPAVYFVHSYYVDPTDAGVIAARATYESPFCAAVIKDSLAAVQFHPEKSGEVGLQFLKNFCLSL